MDVFEIGTYRPESFQLYPAGNINGGGMAFNGPAPASDWSSGGHWVLRMENFQLDATRVLYWRKLMMSLRSGIDEVIIPIIDPDFVHTNTGSYFCGGGALRATQMYFASDAGQTLLGGEYFSVYHSQAGPRLYLISEAGPKVEGQQLIKFGPPLREAVLNGEECDFENPSCVFRITSEPSEVWPKLVPPYKAKPSLTAVESFSYLEAA